MSKPRRGFTLVELLAVIVILAVILVIAVPQIMNVITESRKGALISSAKLIASSAENAYISNQTLGIEKDIECSDVSNYTAEDYKSCDITFVDGKAQVTLVGQGKFEGMRVCSGTKEDAVATENNKCPVPTVSFEKDSWATIKAAVTAGDTENYNVGDTKTVDLGTLGTHIVRIANKSNDWVHCGEEGYSQTACGFVVEFEDIITKHKMNDTNTNAGGWPGSQMYTYVNGNIYNALPEELRSVILKTKVVSSHGSADTNNFESEDYLYLLSPEEVYGSSYMDSNDSSSGMSRQLDWYEENGVTTSSYGNATKLNAGTASYWFLRGAHSSTSYVFFRVGDSGFSSNIDATYNHGVSPAFRLG